MNPPPYESSPGDPRPPDYKLELSNGLLSDEALLVSNSQSRRVMRNVLDADAFTRWDEQAKAYAAHLERRRARAQLIEKYASEGWVGWLSWRRRDHVGDDDVASGASKSESGQAAEADDQGGLGSAPPTGAGVLAAGNQPSRS